ncbi:hypothetical protein QBC38DRAFT_440490 [Podospora fimiseda]|uniref:Uncharacterized protein n=1 Tax=Podospora fimiseda TaxID=252190 RepID=A0AAN7BX20_9PEZI|nr:hypothetical protein QBC38DRAFT_440490 [Podospora fimiseda]
MFQHAPTPSLMLTTVSLVLLAGWSLVNFVKRRPQPENGMFPRDTLRVSVTNVTNYRVDTPSKTQQIQEPTILSWRRNSNTSLVFPPRTRASLSSSVLGRKGSNSSCLSWEDSGSSGESQQSQQSVGSVDGRRERLLFGVGEQFLVEGEEE